MVRYLTLFIILLSVAAHSGVQDQCTPEGRLGFFGRLKSAVGNQIDKVKRHNQTKAKNNAQMKQNDKTAFVGQYHTVSSCGVYQYSDPFKGGMPTKVIANKRYNSPDDDLVNFNIKDRRGSMSGRASCANERLRTLGAVGRTRIRKIDKGAGVLLMVQSVQSLYNHSKHVCMDQNVKFYNKDFSVGPYFDNFGGLMNGKRRFPGIGTFGPTKAENNIADLCGKLRGNIMLRTPDNSTICMGYSKNGTDEITVYVNPKDTIYTQRVILRKKSAFNKYSVPSCKAKEWLNTRWTTR